MFVIDPNCTCPRCAPILYNRVGNCPYCQRDIRGSDELRVIQHYQGPCAAMQLIPHANYDLQVKAFFNPVSN